MVKEKKVNKLRTYIFDWDDNILHMPTKIKMDKNVGGLWVPIDVSTEDFALIRGDVTWRLRNNDPNVAFSNFRGYTPFIEDVNLAISKKMFAPSMGKFREALVYANPFCVNTARGHTPKALKDGTFIFINKVFTELEKKKMVESIKKRYDIGGDNQSKIIESYLTECGEYYPVSSEEFREKFNILNGGADSPEESKKVAIKDFIEKVLRDVGMMVDGGYQKLSVGFSDDDIKNVKSVENLIIEELNEKYPNIHFVIYDTSNKGTNKIIIQRK